MTQQQKIIKLMLLDWTKTGEAKWWYASDFMKPELGEYFVGYEATARLSELYNDCHNILIKEKDGKYRVLKINIEKLKDPLIALSLPKDMCKIVERWQHGFNI